MKSNLKTYLTGVLLIILVILINIAEFISKTNNSDNPSYIYYNNNDLDDKSNKKPSTNSSSSETYEENESYDEEDIDSSSKIILNRQDLDFEDKINYVQRRIKECKYFNGYVHVIIVNRNEIVRDSFIQLQKLSNEDLKKKRIRITFTKEKGFDYTGLTKEWLTLVTEKMVDPDFGLFSYAEHTNYTICPKYNSKIDMSYLSQYKFLGNLIAIAIIRNININLNFNRFMYKYILNQACDLSDIKYISETLYNNLLNLNKNSVKEYGLSFSFDVEDFDNKIKTIELKPNGANIDVEDCNKEEFMALYVKERLIGIVEPQLKAIRDGIFDILEKDLLTVFTPEELELFICGKSEIDVEDWKANTIYYNYTPDDTIIIWFWKIVNELNPTERIKLLQFCTGSKRVPFGGFKELRGNGGITIFTIAKIDESKSTGKFPLGRTCFNVLYIPWNQTYEELKSNIKTVINFPMDFGFQ